MVFSRSSRETRKKGVLTVVVLTTIMDADDRQTTRRRRPAAPGLPGRGGVPRALAHDRLAVARPCASPQGRGPVGNAVQRPPHPAWGPGRAPLRRDCQTHDYAGSGYHPAARPAGKTRPDLPLPGNRRSTGGDGPDHQGRPHPADPARRTGPGGASPAIEPPRPGTAAATHGTLTGCPLEGSLIFGLYIRCND